MNHSLGVVLILALVLSLFGLDRRLKDIQESIESKCVEVCEVQE